MSSTISPLLYTQTMSPTSKAATAQAGTSSSSKSSTPSNPAAALNGVTASKSTFLTLLVAQLKNQNPLSPTDGTQFVSELAQFSSLEQLTNLNQSVGSIAQVVAPAKSSSGSAGSGAGSGTGTPNPSGTSSSGMNSSPASTSPTSSPNANASNAALNNAIANSGMISNVS